MGSIDMVDSLRFQKFMFRATKGKCFISLLPINCKESKFKIIDPANPFAKVNKGVFLFIYNQSVLME